MNLATDHQAQLSRIASLFAEIASSERHDRAAADAASQLPPPAGATVDTPSTKENPHT